VARASVALSLALLLLAFAPAALAADAAAGGKKLTYQDDVLPIFRNACLNCHNPDKKKADLDLSTHAGVMTGGGDGKVVVPGDPGGSKLYRTMTRAEEPFMPMKADKLPEAQLNVIRDWIAAGAPENSSSKVSAVKKPTIDLTAVGPVKGRPAGPPPMPKALAVLPAARPARAGAVTALAASPWAPLVAVGGPRQVNLFHADTLAPLGALAFPEGQPNVLQFSRDGSLLLVAGGQAAKAGRVALFNIADGKRVTELGDEYDEVLAADLSPDRALVALGGPAKLLKAYATADGRVAYSVKKHTDWVTAVAFSPDGALLASGDRAGNLYVFEARNGREVYTLSGHKEGVTALAFRDDGTVLASASADGTVKLWNMAEGTPLKSVSAHAGGVLSLAFAHDGRFVSAGRDKVAKLWGSDGAALKSCEAFGDIALHARITHDGARILAGDWTGAVRAFNATDGKLAGTIAGPQPAAPVPVPAAAAAPATKPAKPKPKTK